MTRRDLLTTHHPPSDLPGKRCGVVTVHVVDPDDPTAAIPPTRDGGIAA